MEKRDLKDRPKPFALRVLNLIDALPQALKGRLAGDQLGRAGTSGAANDRPACRAGAQGEFISKLATVIEEPDAATFWPEAIMEGRLLDRSRLAPLRQEADEIVAIMTRSRKTAESNLKTPKS